MFNFLSMSNFPLSFFLSIRFYSNKKLQSQLKSSHDHLLSTDEEIDEMRERIENALDTTDEITTMTK